MKNNFNKVWELTSRKFLALTIFSHVSLMYVLISLPVLHLLCVITIAILILLFSSVPVYHRFLSHRSWNCPRWYEIFASIFGVFGFTGSTISRTVTHRQHHAFADTDKDPHSPLFSPWYKIYFPFFNQKRINSNLAKDLISDPLHRNIHKFYLLIILTGYTVAWMLFDFNWAITLIIAPGSLCWANVCILNIFGHQTIGGTNSSTLSFITLGEGNHKYHHASPTQSNTGNDRFDIAYLLIKLIEKTK
jgi:stearoyl-CoA desaturase (Delta-9 desaturase)